MATNKVQEGRYIDYANSTGDTISSGSPVLYDGVGRIGIAMTDIADGESGALDTEGVYDLTKDTATDVFTKGLANNKLSSDYQIQLNAGDGTEILNAVVVAASSATDTTVRMKLLG